jgi:hypothetical protein
MSESDKNLGNMHTAEHKDVPSRSALCISFYLVISISCYTLFIGSLWAIMDAFVPTGKLDWFREQTAMLQIIIAGGFGIVGVVGVLMLWFLYPKGTRLIHKMLYPPITKEKFEKGNILARFITAGLLISIFVIVIGSVLTLIELVVIEGGSFLLFLANTPNGLLIMLFSSILVVFTSLVIIFTWVWINGYQKTLKWISDSNARIDRTEIDNAEWSTGVTLYIIILISILGAAFGGAWYGMEAFSSYINWTNFGTTTLVIGGLGSLVFLALIGGLVMFSRGSYTISRLLFMRKQQISEKLDSLQDKNFARSITIIILTAIALLIIGAVGILVDYLMSLASGGTGTFLEFLKALPSIGVWISIFSGMLFGGIWVLIFIIYTWTHGYYAFFNAVGAKILRDNEKIERDRHSKAQVIFGVIVYSVIWLSVFGIVYGAIWWGLEAFNTELATSRISLQFLIYESMGSVFFLVLTAGLLLSRRLVFFISKMLFVRREDIPENAEKQDKIMAGIITIALLVAIALVLVGSFGLLVDYLVDPTIIDLILLQPLGVLIMIASGMTLISMWILIFVIYIWTHGFYIFYNRFLRRISKN